MAILLPLTILGGILFGMVTRNMEQEFHALFLRQSERLGSILDAEISKTDVTAETILNSSSSRSLQSEGELDPLRYATLDNLKKLLESFRFATASNELISFLDLSFGTNQMVVRSGYGMCPLGQYPYRAEVRELMGLPAREKTADLLLLDSPQGACLVRRFPIFSFAAKQTDVLLVGLDLRRVCALMDDSHSGLETYLFNRSTRQVISEEGALLSERQRAALPFSADAAAGAVHSAADRPDELWIYTDSAFPDWCYVTRADVSEYYRQIHDYRINFILLTLAVVLLTILVSFGIMQKTSEPIGMFLSIVKDPSQWLGTSDMFQERIAETGQITRSFLASYQKNQELEDSLQSYTQKLREAQLAALRSQVNPHFLYNTLDTIYWSVLEEVQGDSRLPEVVTSLSDMLRYGLEDGGNLITIEREYVHARAYVNIMQYRYDYRFQVVWDIAPELLTHKIIKVTLQPLLENALTHGLGQCEAGAEIRVSIRREGSRIHVAVRDNGRGFPPEHLERLTARLSRGERDQSIPASHIGLENVNLRYKLVVGSSAEMHLRNRPEGGAEVEICYEVMEEAPLP